MTWLYAAAAVVTSLTGVAFVFRSLRRGWRYVRRQLGLLDQLPWLVGRVKAHDDALVDAGLIRRSHRPPWKGPAA